MRDTFDFQFEKVVKVDGGTVYSHCLGDSDMIKESYVKNLDESLKDLKEVTIGGTKFKVAKARVGSYCNLVNRRYHVEVMV